MTREFSINKTVDVSVAEPGDVVEYTIVVTNESSEPFPAGAPAAFTDDLTGVLDDATYNGDVGSSTGATTLDASAGTLSWSGPLTVGGDATITYSVTVDDLPAGDATLENVVTGPPGSNCETTADPACSTSTPTRWIQIEKVADFDVVDPGDRIGYTITVTNEGTAPYTNGTPAAVADDLSGALDDATWNDEATTSVGTTSYSTPILSWSAALGAGQTATITYSLTVDDPPTGDRSIDNYVIGLVTGNCRVDDRSPNAQRAASQLTGLGNECITETQVTSSPTPTTMPPTIPPTTQPTTSIPATGSDPAPIGRVAVLLLFAGGAFLAVARTRSRRS